MFNLKKFGELNLKQELVDALNYAGFQDMTEVQEAAIPSMLLHRDIIVRSKTGSGKTVAFLVPIMQMADRTKGPEALIVVPTRELAIQVHAVADKLSRKLGLHTVIVYGGASINVQMDQLARGANIVIGTPGRIPDRPRWKCLRQIPSSDPTKPAALPESPALPAKDRNNLLLQR